MNSGQWVYLHYNTLSGLEFWKQMSPLSYFAYFVYWLLGVGCEMVSWLSTFIRCLWAWQQANTCQPCGNLLFLSQSNSNCIIGREGKWTSFLLPCPNTAYLILINWFIMHEYIQPGIQFSKLPCNMDCILQGSCLTISLHIYYHLTLSIWHSWSGSSPLLLFSLLELLKKCGNHHLD